MEVTDKCVKTSGDLYRLSEMERQNGNTVIYLGPSGTRMEVYKDGKLVGTAHVTRPVDGGRYCLICKRDDTGALYV